MIFDYYSIFSDKQAVTASAASTNIVQVPKGFGYGNRNCLFLAVTEDFATLTSLTIKFQESNDKFSSNTVDLRESYTIKAADLKAGNTFSMELPDNVTQEHIRVYYTVTGSNATAGKIFAAIASTDQKWYTDAQKLGGN